MKQYLFQRRELDNLKGEIWVDIPGLDGAYQVSCFGRVKRLKREVLDARGYLRQLQEQILTADIHQMQNKGIGDEITHLNVSVLYEGKKTKFSIGRMVYYCFVKPFTLEDHSLVVCPKDGDGKNIRPSNLMLVDIARKQQRIFERNRMQMIRKNAYKEYLESGSVKSSDPACIQVSQYSMKGKYLRTFPSIRVASKVTGVSESGIISVVKKRQLSSGNFVWSYSKVAFIDVATIRKTNQLNRQKLVGQLVSQYDLKGKRLAIYPAITVAADQSGVGTSDISAVVNGRQRSAGGFVWRKGHGKKKIDLAGYLTGEVYRAAQRQKKVKQYSAGGKYLKTFASIKEAAAAVKVNASAISTAVKKKRVIKGYCWELAVSKTVK